MNQISFKKSLLILRVCIIAFILSIVSLFLFSFTVSRHIGDELWKQLGISQQQGMQQIRNSFLSNYFDYYSARNAKNIASGNRAAIAKDLLTYSRQYIGSPAFKTQYEKERTQAKPTEPGGSVKSKDAIRSEKVAETKDLIKKTEEIIKTSDASMKKTMEEILEMHRKNLKDYQDPNSEMINMFYQQEVFAHENDMNHYKESLQKWEENYPADIKQLIKSRLQRYLDLAGTVDFDAALVEKNGKKKFVKPEYEAKNAEWKMIFRAGREVYEATRSFAEQWKKEL